MDEHPDSALHYGHVGRAVYFPKTKAWTFARSFVRCTPILYTGVTKTAISSAGHTFELQPPHKISRQADDKLIPNAHPDLAAQWSTINDDAYSKVITNTAELCDPQVSTLFDLGYALDHASDDSKGIPGPLAIAATVTGTSRDTISFRMLVDDIAEIQHDGSQHEGYSLRIPSISDAETAEWSQRGAPIQQICFARPVEGKTTWMAARLKRSIMIFRPILQREPVPAHINGTDTEAFSIPYRNSRLDANPVVELSENVTGGFTLADVTFNPRYPRQFGVVDIMGNWSVWEITGRQRKHGSTYAAGKVSMASLPSTDEKPQIERPRHDGWATIEWVAHFSTVVVSDRRCTVLYQMAGEDIRSSFVELGMEKQSEWVLDLQRSIQNPSHFFVLTTSRLLWFDVTTLPPNPNDTRPPLRPRITWRHFRDPEDTTLRISDLMVNRDLYLILYSRLTDLVQGFPCPLLADEKTESVSVPDPFILEIPKIPKAAGVSSPEDMSRHYSKFVFRQVHHTPTHATKTRYNPNLTLVKLFWTDLSLAVHETLFKGPDNHWERDEKNVLLEGSSVQQVKKNVIHRKKGEIDDEEIDDEEFVVDDWDDSAISRLTLRQTGPKGFTTESSHDRNKDLQWTLDWTSVYAHAVANLMAFTNPRDPEGTQLTLNHIIESLKKAPGGTSGGFSSSETMLEISGNRPVLNDIDEGADDLARLVSTVLPESPDMQAPWRYMILPLRFSNLFHGLESISPEPRLDFLETYNHLVDEWVALLPHGEDGIPDATRVLKERSVRGIALELLLARLIRISNVPSTGKLPESTDAHQSQREPVPSSQHSRQRLSSSQMTYSQRQGAQDKAKEAPARNYIALSAYTVFKEPRPMPRNVGNLLSHWKTGVDPATYEWQKTSRLLDDEGNRTGSRTPRRVRKKRSQLTPAPEASSLPPTPVAPMIRTWSQPDQPPMPIPSSQPTLDEVPMTQVERGQFGAREAKKSSKAKKKRRAAGF